MDIGEERQRKVAARRVRRGDQLGSRPPRVTTGQRDGRTGDCPVALFLRCHRPRITRDRVQHRNGPVHLPRPSVGQTGGHGEMRRQVLPPADRPRRVENGPATSFRSRRT